MPSYCCFFNAISARLPSSLHCIRSLFIWQLAAAERSLISAFLLVFIGFAGYYLVDIIQARINSWINPGMTPSGGSYQIIQSLLAIANGGLDGRGPGLGSPALVPVAISDFIFAAIAEETGLIGTMGLIALFGLILVRGLRAASARPG